MLLQNLCVSLSMGGTKKIVLRALPCACRVCPPTIRRRFFGKNMDSEKNEIAVFAFLCEVLSAIEPPSAKQRSKARIKKTHTAAENFSDTVLNMFAVGAKDAEKLTAAQTRQKLANFKTQYWQEAGDVVDKYELSYTDALALLELQYENCRHRFAKRMAVNVYRNARNTRKILGGGKEKAQKVFKLAIPKNDETGKTRKN